MGTRLGEVSTIVFHSVAAREDIHGLSVLNSVNRGDERVQPLAQSDANSQNSERSDMANGVPVHTPISNRFSELENLNNEQCEDEPVEKTVKDNLMPENVTVVTKMVENKGKEKETHTDQDKQSSDILPEILSGGNQSVMDRINGANAESTGNFLKITDTCLDICSAVVENSNPSFTVVDGMVKLQDRKNLETKLVDRGGTPMQFDRSNPNIWTDSMKEANNKISIVMA